MRWLFLIVFSFFCFISYSQDWEVPKLSERDWVILDSSKGDNYHKRNILLITQIGSYTLTIAGLNFLWYESYPRSRFHFINDNKSWLQMDKLGHATTSYYMGVAGIEAYKWANMGEKKAIWFGGLSGTFFLTAVEVLDGYSKEWGASIGDLTANTLGSALSISQALLWDEQKIHLKYSYSYSPWARENPSVLGSNKLESMLKDYNGQNYWLTFNLKSLFSIQDSYFPSWLSFAFGYGADGMLNPQHQNSDPTRNRQYLFSFDIDLNRIKTKNSFVNSILHTFGFLKFPLPTIELSDGRFITHTIYY